MRRTQRRYSPSTGGSSAWLVRSSAFINFFYFYCVDADFGPFFLKFSTYFPYTAKLCINGNEWAKRQAAKASRVSQFSGAVAGPWVVGTRR